MWSITLTDMMQFLFMTVGIFAILLPFSLSAAGGWSALGERLGAATPKIPM
jgi:SSS family solute:Na+ symporter